MELLEGQKYSREDMIHFFNVSPATFKKNREKLLHHLQAFYEYEIEYDSTDHRKQLYHIIKKNFDYEPPQKKSVKRDQTYQSKIIEVIEQDNVQTAMNVKRLIMDSEEIAAFNHKEGTVYEYTRNNMRIMFGTKAGEFGTRGYIKEKIWCKLDEDNNCYIPLNPEEISNFYTLFNTQKDETKEIELSILSDYKNGLISKDEMNKQIGDTSLYCFISARKTYKTTYGFYPIKVPIYEISAFELTEQEAA